MGFLERVARGAEFRASSGLQFPTGWLQDALSPMRTFAGESVTVRKALGIGPVYTAVSMISETVGMMPLKVYKALDDDTRQLARQHRCWGMLHDAPNPVTPAHRFWSAVIAQLLLWGNAFLEMRRSNGVLVDELWLLPAEQMTIRWDPATRTKTFTQNQGVVGGERQWTTDEVLHIMGFSMDGIVGESPIARCPNTFANAIARDRFEGGFYQRGGSFRGIIEYGGRLGEEGLKNLRTSFGATYGGSDKAHQTPILEEGATFRPVSMPLSEMQFVDAQQLSRTDIAVMFKLPPSYLGGSKGDSLTYATVESERLHYALNAIQPWTSVIESALAADPAIFPQNVYYAEFTLEALLKADAKTRADFYALMFEIADEKGRRALTVDEIRAMENREPAEELPPELTVGQPPPNGNGNGLSNGTVPDVVQPLQTDTKLPAPRRPRARF